MISQEGYEVVARIWQEGPAPLVDPVPGMAERQHLRLALVIPPFKRGSGGHNTLFQIFSRLEQRGHACSVWLADYSGDARDQWPAVLRHAVDRWRVRPQRSVKPPRRRRLRPFPRTR